MIAPGREKAEPVAAERRKPDSAVSAAAVQPQMPRRADQNRAVPLRFLPALLLILLVLAGGVARADQGPPLPFPGGNDWVAALDRHHPLTGRIWVPAEARFIPAWDLSRRLVGADVVLLGERHDNPDHHRLQAWAISAMIAGGRRPLTAFEMIGPEQTAAVEAARSQHPVDLDALGQSLNWEKSLWPDWSFYRPLFGLALDNGLVIRSANLSPDLVRAIARAQPIPEETRRRLGLDQPPPPALLASMAREIRQSHCGMLPESAVPPMVDVQRARDRTMALALADAGPEGGLLIAGAGHTRTDRGVPWHLQGLAPGRSLLSLAFLEVEPGETDPAAYGRPYDTATPPFDAVVFTPRASDDDPCAGMAAFMKRKTGQ
jgi:uncharacterized iron-regulated protein